MKTTFQPNLNILLYKYEYDFIKWIDKECKEYRYNSDNSPMWIQYKGFDWDTKDKIYFKSSQYEKMNLTIEIDKKDVDLFTGVAFDIKKLDYKEIYNHFRDLKYNYIRNNYPEIYNLHDSWRKLNYNKTI